MHFHLWPGVYPTAKVEKWHAKSFTLQKHFHTSSATSLPHLALSRTAAATSGMKSMTWMYARGASFPFAASAKVRYPKVSFQR